MLFDVVALAIDILIAWLRVHAQFQSPETLKPL